MRDFDYFVQMYTQALNELQNCILRAIDTVHPADKPTQAHVSKLLDTLITATEGSGEDFRAARDSIAGWSEPIPEDTVEDFETSILNDLAKLNEPGGRPFTVASTSGADLLKRFGISS